MKLGYCRVSTEDQNLGRQIEALNNAGCEFIYKEKMSGKDTNRPELIAMLQAAQPGDLIIVQKLDRLGRSLVDLLDIMNSLRDKGVGFQSLSESIDTTSAHGRFVFSILGAAAEFERQMILERVNNGIAYAKRQGKHLGRPAKIDRDAFEADYRSGMKNADLAKKHEISLMGVHRNIKRIKEKQKCPTPGLSATPPSQA